MVDIATVLDSNVEELARNLTFLETMYFSKISITELMNKRFEKPDRSPNLSSTIERFNAVTSWVATTIVMAPSVSKRVDVIARFIDLAKALEGLNNYSGVIQIVSALQNVSISRLKQTWALVPPRSVKLFEELCPYANPEGIYSFYRKASANVKSSFLPYLGCFTKDLTAIEEMTTQLPGNKINWEKMTHLGKILLTIHKTQQFPHRIQPNVVLCRKLMSFKLMTEKGIYRVSKTLEASASGPGATGERITRKTIEREKKLEAKEERAKAKQVQRAQREQRGEKRSAVGAATVCTKCAHYRGRLEGCRLISSTLNKERQDLINRQALIDHRLADFAGFLSTATVGFNASGVELVTETKAELFKQFFDVSQLETAISENAKRMTDSQDLSTQDFNRKTALRSRIQRYLVTVNKLQSSLPLLRQSSAESPEYFAFIQWSLTQLMGTLLLEIQSDFPQLALDKLTDSPALPPASPAPIRRPIGSGSISKFASLPSPNKFAFLPPPPGLSELPPSVPTRPQLGSSGE